MLAKAQARGLYDVLQQAELGAFLAGTPDRYDLAVAADVFCYFGALDAAFAALAGKTTTGGLLGFTVEAMPGAGSASGPAEGYRLGPTGRYPPCSAHVRAPRHPAASTAVRWGGTT